MVGRRAHELTPAVHSRPPRPQVPFRLVGRLRLHYDRTHVLHICLSAVECRGMPGLTRPVGGVDYPRTYQEFKAWFPDDVACREYLGQLRWPDGFLCPECGCGGGWRTGQGLWM